MALHSSIHNLLVVEDTGSVGIGSTDPYKKLDINGDISLSKGNAHSTIEMATSGALTIKANENTVNATSFIDFQLPLTAGSGTLESKVKINHTSIVLNEKVGIGTGSPSFNLHVYSASAGDSTYTGGILVENAGNGTGEAAVAYKTQDTGSNYWFTGLNQDNHLAFSYGTSFGDGGAKMNILPGGGVGIGTTDVKAAANGLHVKTGAAGGFTANAAHDDVIIEGSGNTGINIFSPNTSYQYLAFGDPEGSNSGYVRYYHGGNQMVLRAGGSDTVYINDGRVGVGTASPAGKMHVYTGSGTNDPVNTLVIQRASTSDYSGISFRTGSSTDWSIGHNSTGGFTIYENGANATTRFIIKDGGKVGIGTTNPQNSLQVASTDKAIAPLVLQGPVTNGMVLLAHNYLGNNEYYNTQGMDYSSNAWMIGSGVYVDGATSRKQLSTQDNYVTRGASLYVDGANGVIDFYTSNSNSTRTKGTENTDITHRLRIAASGNVGIGTNDPHFAKLTINQPRRLDGGTGAIGQMVVAGPISNPPTHDFSSSNAIFRIQGTDATNNLQFGVGGSGYSYHPWIQGSYDNSSGSDNFGAKDILLQPIGGYVGIGTTNPSAPLTIYHSTTGAEPYTGITVKNTDTSGTYYTGVTADAVGQTHYRYMLSGALKWQTRVGAGNGTDDFRLYSWTKSADVMVVKNNGAFGIGKADPKGSTGGYGMDIQGTLIVRAPLNAHDTSAGVFERNGDKISLRAYGATAGTGYLSFQTGGGGGSSDTQRMVIEAGGNVGIATGNAHGLLHLHQDNTRFIMGAATSNLAAQHRIEFWETAATTTSTNANFAIEYDGTASYGGDGALLFRGSASAPISTQNYVFGGVSRNGTTFFNNKLALGRTSPSANLDVYGGTGSTSLLLRSGNVSTGTSGVQIAMGYANENNYKHSIRTRHNSGAGNGNAIDFYAWRNGQSASTMGDVHIMTLEGVGGGRVGIGLTNPVTLFQVWDGTAPGSSQWDYRTAADISASNGNTSHLEFHQIRTAAGSDWTYTGTRIQQRIDSTFMGYLQFNGNGNNYGVSIGAGGGTAGPEAATERLRIDSSGNVMINQTSVSYSTGDNTRKVGSYTTNKLHVNGSIQLANNNDAIVIGNGTATFLTDEEIGFGWGGGWYMTDGTWLRVRNNKAVYSTGKLVFGGDSTIGNSTDDRAASLTVNHSHTNTFAANSDIGDGNRNLTVQNPTTNTSAGIYTALHLQNTPGTDGSRNMTDLKLVRDSGNQHSLYITMRHGASDFRDVARFKSDGKIEARHYAGQAVNYATSQMWAANTANTNNNQVGMFGGNFTTNGANNWCEWDNNPFDQRALVWKCIDNDTTSNDDGGWNKTMQYLDPNMPYLSYVYVRRNGSATSGSFYHGCSGSETKNLNGADNTNPYFHSFNIGTLPQDVWCLSIGLINAAGDPTTTGSTKVGVYRMDTGQKIVSGSTYKMRYSSGLRSQVHRTYLYYSTNTSSSLSWWSPGFYMINGHEPKLSDLLGANNRLVIYNSAGTAVKYVG